MIYLFEFVLSNGESLFLTSSNSIITQEYKKYLPNSGLSLQYVKKENLFIEILIKGFFEKNGIEKKTYFEKATLKVFLFDQQIKEFLFLEFFAIKNDLISFEITFISKSNLLRRTLLSRISKSCRAALGDNRCKIDISQLLEQTKILYVDKNKIIIYKCSRPDGYFNNGRLVCKSGKNYDIVSSTANEIIINREVDFEIGIEIILYPSCDKQFSSCIKKFNNAINFRGEPFIGENYEREK